MANEGVELSRRKLLGLMGVTAAAAATDASTAIAAPAVAQSEPTARLFFTDVGSGTNVMLLHGWTCDSHDWSWQLPLFESKYRVVVPDLRGHGRSEVMPSGSYSPADYVTDIEALILAGYQGHKFVLVGHSMGAQIATRLAVKRPDLVRAVVSIDGALGFGAAAARLFSKTAQDLADDDPDMVVPALFAGVYDSATDPAFKRWHTRRVQGMPKHVVRESFSPLFTGPDQVGVEEASARFCRRLTIPFYHLCRDPPPHAAVVLGPQVEGGSVDRNGTLGHARPQGRREHRGGRMDRRVVAMLKRLRDTGCTSLTGGCRSVA